jgi:hypothetical protein
VANPAETTITLTDAPDEGERAVIMDRLRAYNEAQAGVSDGGPLAILVRDPETGKVAGGLLGRTYLGLLTIERFFLLEDLRRGRLRSWILAMAEEEARRRGAHALDDARLLHSALFAVMLRHHLDGHGPNRQHGAALDRRFRHSSRRHLNSWLVLTVRRRATIEH